MTMAAVPTPVRPSRPHRCECCPGGPVHDRGRRKLQEEQDHLLRCFFDSLGPSSGGAASSHSTPKHRRLETEQQWDDFKLRLKDRGLLGFDDLALLQESPLASPVVLHVLLDKPKRGPLATPVDVATLALGEVQAQCAFAEWNRRHHDCQVHAGDRIRKVNGKDRRDAILAALEERGCLAVELERPGVDAEGLEAWLSQRAWGKHLESMDHDVEAMRGAIHSVNSLVGYRGIENLTREELYTYQVLLAEYEHGIADTLREALARARAAEAAVGGPFVATDLRPSPTPAVAAAADVASAPAAESPAAIPRVLQWATTPEEFQWTRGPEIERRLREIRVPAVAFPPGAPALERTLWGLRRVAATAVTTGEEVEVLEVPWDVPPDCADYVALLTNRLEALQQLALSPYFPDYLGCDFSSYAGVGLHFLRRKQGVSLRQLLAVLGPLPERHPLFLFWAREILMGLREYLHQCCHELTDDITLAHVYIHQEGTRVIFQGVPFGARRGTLFEDLPEYGPDNLWRNNFESLQARLASMFGEMLLELVMGPPPPAGTRPLLQGTVSEGIRNLLAQALNARHSLDFMVGQLPPDDFRDGWLGEQGAGIPMEHGQHRRGPADSWVGLSSGLVATGLDQYGGALAEELHLWWVSPGYPHDVSPLLPNTERSVDAANAAFASEWSAAASPEAPVEAEAPFALPWQPNAEPTTLQSLLEHPALQGPTPPLLNIMEAWHVLFSRYEATVSRARFEAARK